MMKDRRASWYVLSVALILPTIVTWIYFVALHGAPQMVQRAAYAVLKCAQFSLPVAAIGFLARSELWRASFHVKGIGVGAAFGILVALLIYGMHEWVIRGTESEDRLRDMILEKVQGLGLATHVKFILLGCFYSLIHSGLEEYYWRWFVFRWALRLMNPPRAMILSSVGFMLHHILVLGFLFGFGSWQTWVFSAAVAVGGAFWAWLYHRTGSLLAIWISHALVDAGIFSLGYVIVSESL